MVIAILLPCLNEALTIAEMIAVFRRTLPDSQIYVYDNHSCDDTAKIAREQGAIVRYESHQGKGNVIRRMFADIEADIYLLIDADCTYDYAKAPEMIEKLQREQLDMVVGARAYAEKKQEAYRYGHSLANKIFSKLVSHLFGGEFTDIFSGYRVFSRRFVKSFPCKTRGFEIESELTIHALEMQIPSAEVQTHYYSRPTGSKSKLRSCYDGIKILSRIFILLKEVRPFFFFSCISLFLIAFAISIFLPVLNVYLNTGLVPRFPTAILSTGIVLMAIILFACGVILDNVGESRRELKRLFYLSLSPHHFFFEKIQQSYEKAEDINAG